MFQYFRANVGEASGLRGHFDDHLVFIAVRDRGSFEDEQRE